MASASTVPEDLRLLLDDIIHAVLDEQTATTTLQIYRLVGDILDTWLDQRTQLELGTPPQHNCDQRRNKSTTNRKNETKKGKTTAAK